MDTDGGMPSEGSSSHIQGTSAKPTRPTVVRVSGLPFDKQSAETYIRRTIERYCNSTSKHEISIIPSCLRPDETVALVDFEALPEFLLELEYNPLGSWQICIEGQDLQFDRHFVGFTQLYEPIGNIEADVIAICGIDGHGYGSWQGRGSQRRMWLRHFLPREFPACRTMIYGYNAKLAVRSYAGAEDYVLEFIESLKLIRDEKTARRLIVFLAHSFGGLILSRSIIKAKLQDQQTFLSSILGIMFFAVPHTGIDVEDMSRIIGVEQHPRNVLLQQIKIDSELLREQLHDFVDVVACIKIVSLYETEQSRRLVLDAAGNWKRTGELLKGLEARPAVLQLPSHMETRVPVHTDHSNIVKFNSDSDPHYKLTISYLKSIINEQTLAEKTQELQIDAIKHRLSGIEAGTLRTSPHMLPLRNPGFVGRQEILEDLEQRLISFSQTSCFAIYGLGGTGKTHVALELCYTIKARYSEYSIFWVLAVDKASFQRGFIKLAKIYSLPTGSNEDNVMSTVQEYLSSSTAGKWLLVIDSIDEDDIFLEYLPQSETGKVLFTTRYKDTAVDLAGANVFHLGQMNLPEAEIFLAKLLPGHDLALNVQATRDLVEELACLPLAIAQVAAYIHKSSMTVSKCLDVMRRSEIEFVRLLTRESRDSTRSGKENRSAVATVWLKSFKRMKDTEPEAINMLLSLGSSSFDFTEGVLPVSKSDNPFHVSGVLVGYSFLITEARQRCRVYPLVHLMAKQWIQKENAIDQSQAQATQLLMATLPKTKRQE